MSNFLNFIKENKEKTFFIFILFWLLVIAQIDTYSQLTTSGTFAATMRLAIPILLAGLGGIFSERSGVVNIGLEGMMIMGTWFGAWAAWLYGPWWGVAAGIFGGLIFGLIHAIATVSFQVDHIVSGVAINILAAGTARFFSVVAYANESQGGATQSPRISGEISSFSLPFLSGGTFLGNETSDWLRNLEDLNLFFISDISGLLGGFTRDISYLSFIALSLVPICMWILWSTPFGLQLRSVGEFPIGSESLGINVYLMKYIGVTLSGAFSGLAGAYLVIESSGIYRENQTGGRGFIALASVIFGNWRPTGVLMGSGLFGYADALQLRSEESVHGLLLLISIVLLALSIYLLFSKKSRNGAISLLMAFGFGIWFLNSTSVPNEFVYFTPHITTLVVLSFASQRLRMPKAVGQPYKKGQGG
jgi:simple sugar transport system permease protein